MGAEPIVALDRVTKRYRGDGREQTVLDGLSLQVRAGEMVSIVGPSGCGKTTLLNLMGALDRPDAGTVRCCGIDLTTADRATLTAYRAREVGFVFQFYNLLATLTALENVEAGLTVAGISRAEAKRRARRILARVGLQDAVGKFPAQLSGGEQQRVAIARALGKQPALVLADEPTGNLDQDTSAQVTALLRALNTETGTTLVVVTHNPTVGSAADRAVRLEHGRVVERERT
ncbi:MAG TPA: ABC transporter ATP-binding protein [Actinomycetota bacterium]|jgi:putative ABC transport system ATP-binding protein|nr:ABC transporter ATP-binding protein [Actinomycetota bacterium]